MPVGQCRAAQYRFSAFSSHAFHASWMYANFFPPHDESRSNPSPVTGLHLLVRSDRMPRRPACEPVARAVAVFARSAARRQAK